MDLLEYSHIIEGTVWRTRQNLLANKIYNNSVSCIEKNKIILVTQKYIDNKIWYNPKVYIEFLCKEILYNMFYEHDNLILNFQKDFMKL